MSFDQPITECPVSGHSLRAPSSRQAFRAEDRKWPGFKFECPHCGTFIVDEFELHHLAGYLSPPELIGTTATPRQAKRHRAVLAHALSRMEVHGQTPILRDGMTLRILREDRLPSLAEQRDNLLRWLGKDAEIGRTHPVFWEISGARVGSESPGVLRILLESMLSNNLLSGKLAADAGGEFRLAYGGLQRLEELERASPSGCNAFMAMQFNNAVLDRIVDEYFRPAVEDTGFKLFRLDDRPEAGLIDARLRNEIRTCRFLIADLSHANAGSYWEAGYAEGLGKPVIYTCEKSVFDGNTNFAKPHFDTNHHLTIIWEEDGPQTAADKLKETIRYTIPEARGSCPAWWCRSGGSRRSRSALSIAP
jgi:hypothetical protein